jgi:hypothetical protein
MLPKKTYAFSITEKGVENMPQAFDKCREAGGKIRTITLKGNKYMHICILGGKSYPGEVKTKEGSKTNKWAEALKNGK